MAELRVTFTLGERDLRHFKQILARAVEATPDRDESDVVRAARDMIARARAASPPDYVLTRLERLETIVRITQDKGWEVPAAVRRRILAAVHYLTRPDDLIPDQIPGLGFLDDAIMIELLERSLLHELDAYTDFCRFREVEEQRPWHAQGRVTRERKLERRRRQLRARVQAREKRDIERAGESGRRRFKLL